ncbi:MAG: prepilin-type N-terminal cleavage/methylation domain-containing protein [Candidatus Sumerlaeota bacterium]
MRKAFTLIELLIVVAIIAILAAIAVPNFLEAQTRAKVSRARTDLRSVSVALEAYRVDYTRYAPMLGDNPGQPQNRLNGYGNVRLNAWRAVPHNYTTPVAFITSAIPDVFKVGKTEKTAGTDLGHAWVSGNPFDASFAYHNIRQYVEYTNNSGAWTTADIGDYGEWRIFSLGPQGKYATIGTNDPTRGWLYDPTNGTLSTGMIIRTQFDTVGAHFTR